MRTRSPGWATAAAGVLALAAPSPAGSYTGHFAELESELDARSLALGAPSTRDERRLDRALDRALAAMRAESGSKARDFKTLGKVLKAIEVPLAGDGGIDAVVDDLVADFDGEVGIERETLVALLDGENDPRLRSRGERANLSVLTLLGESDRAETPLRKARLFSRAYRVAHRAAAFIDARNDGSAPHPCDLPETPGGVGEFMCSVDGEAFRPESVSVEVTRGTGGEAFSHVRIAGDRLLPSVSSVSFDFGAGVFTGKGDYVVAPDRILRYKSDATTYVASWGRVTITKWDEATRRIEGRFYFDATELGGSATVQVRSGDFCVCRFPVDAE